MDWIKKFFGIKEFNEILIKKEVIENIMELAISTHPKEFIMFLKGKILKNKLVIYALVFQTYQASNRATAFKINLPPFSKVIGTVHSHPGYSNKPSNADLTTFGRYGIFHLIICKPYRLEDINGYDNLGSLINFKTC